MTELHFKSAVELARRIREKQIGCLDLLEHFLARVEKYNPALNAIIWTDLDGARQRARAADDALARGEVWGPLHGVPMTIKESYNVIGSPTTWGKPEFKDNIADANALTVDRLLAAGVVLFGKTNVPLDLADWQSFNAIYGTCGNPWNPELTPGGSSGGSGAALAAGLSGIDAGSDIGSSIRNPAHFCGVFGLKPTYGIIPQRGQALPGTYAAGDLSVVGPLSRGPEDLTVALDVMAGPDLFDDVGWRLELPAAPQTSLKDFRIAVKLGDANCDVDSAYADKLQDLVDALAKAGATVAEAEPDIDTDRAHAIYVRMLRAATSRRSDDAEFARFLQLAAAYPEDDQSYKANMARGVGLSHRDWLALNNERHAMRFKWAAFFEDWDILLCPVAASAAWPHDQQGDRADRVITVNNRQVPTTDQMFWAGYSLLVYLPSSVGPAGLQANGLPVGYQAIAGHLRDRTALRLSELIARDIVGFQPPPGYD